MSSDNHDRSAGRVPSGGTEVLAAQDDPRVASVLAAYLADLESGRRPSRERLLEEHPEIAEALVDWFDVVEFVHSAARSGYSSHAHVPAEDSLPPETMLGEYQLVREIGRGGMAIVYEAVQVSLSRRVALKVLSSTAALDPLKLQRFRVETQAVAQLNHPHIVPIFAVGSERGSHFYAMQYIEGPTLAELIRQDRRAGPPSPDAPGSAGRSSKRAKSAVDSSGASGLAFNGTGTGAPDDSPAGLAGSGTGLFRGRRAFRALAKLGIQAADALAHAHTMGILHRDIKPSNLLVDARGNLWVTDFGLARFQDEPGLTHTGDLLGTLRYMAPELVLGHRIVHDPRSDIYSLGATLFELLTKQPVFGGRNRQELLRQIAQEEPVSPSKLDPAIPRDFETIILKAMDKEPERRYASAQELADDLRLFLADKPILARRPTWAERSAKWARRHRAVLRAAAAVAFVALAIAAPLLWWEQQKTAQVNLNLRRTFEQADFGFEGFIRLSDELTMQGMTRYAEPGGSPEAMQVRTVFFKQAIEFYERLVKEPQITKPIKALAYRRLAFARMVGPQDPRAEQDYKRSLELYGELLAESPGDRELRRAIADAQMNLGVYLLLTRRAPEAGAAFDRVKSIDDAVLAEFPADPDSLAKVVEHRIQWIAVLSSNAPGPQADHELQELLAIYEKLSVVASESPNGTLFMAGAYRYLAKQLEQVRRFPEEQEALRRALKLGGKDPETESNLARSIVLKADVPAHEAALAIDLAKQAVAAKPNDRGFLNTLALAYLRAGELPAAAEAATKALGLGSPGADGSEQLLMAVICWRRGEKEAALDRYIQALEVLSRNPRPGPMALTLKAEADGVLKRSAK